MFLAQVQQSVYVCVCVCVCVCEREFGTLHKEINLLCSHVPLALCIVESLSEQEHWGISGLIEGTLSLSLSVT